MSQKENGVLAHRSLIGQPKNFRREQQNENQSELSPQPQLTVETKNPLRGKTDLNKKIADLTPLLFKERNHTSLAHKML